MEVQTKNKMSSPTTFTIIFHDFLWPAEKDQINVLGKLFQERHHNAVKG